MKVATAQPDAIQVTLPEGLPPGAHAVISRFTAMVARASHGADVPTELAPVREYIANALSGDTHAVLGVLFLSALTDLAIQGWVIEYDDEVATLTAPTSAGLSALDEKNRVRLTH